MFNATFNSISAISWRSVLLVEETRGPGENHRPVAIHWQTLSHNVVHLAISEIFEFTTSEVIGTDCIGSCQSNYHTITATTAPIYIFCHCPNKTFSGNLWIYFTLYAICLDGWWTDGVWLLLPCTTSDNTRWPTCLPSLLSVICKVSLTYMSPIVVVCYL